MENTNSHIYEIDLHGLNMLEAKIVLDEVIEYVKEEIIIREIHIIVGQGKGSETGPVLPYFVGNYLDDKGIRFKTENGIIYAEFRH